MRRDRELFPELVDRSEYRAGQEDLRRGVYRAGDYPVGDARFAYILGASSEADRHDEFSGAE